MGSPYKFCLEEGWYPIDVHVLLCSEWGYRREQAPVARIDSLFDQLHGASVCSLKLIFDQDSISWRYKNVWPSELYLHFEEWFVQLNDEVFWIDWSLDLLHGSDEHELYGVSDQVVVVEIDDVLVYSKDEE
jgi:hypothetical protein